MIDLTERQLFLGGHLIFIPSFDWWLTINKNKARLSCSSPKGTDFLTFASFACLSSERWELKMQWAWNAYLSLSHQTTCVKVGFKIKNLFTEVYSVYQLGSLILCKWG